jgi:hypothetical protein
MMSHQPPGYNHDSRLRTAGITRHEEEVYVSQTVGPSLDQEHRTGPLLDPDLRLWIPCHWLDSPH